MNTGEWQDGGICVYCHSPSLLIPTTFEIDHIVPLNSGGQTALETLCLAWPACNPYKGAMEVAVDLLTGEEALHFHPLQQKWSQHFSWSEDQSDIQSLTPTGRATITTFHMNRPG